MEDDGHWQIGRKFGDLPLQLDSLAAGELAVDHEDHDVGATDVHSFDRRGFEVARTETEQDSRCDRGGPQCDHKVVTSGGHDGVPSVCAFNADHRNRRDTSKSMMLMPLLNPKFAIEL